MWKRGTDGKKNRVNRTEQTAIATKCLLFCILWGKHPHEVVMMVIGGLLIIASWLFSQHVNAPFACTIHRLQIDELIMKFNGSSLSLHTHTHTYTFKCTLSPFHSLILSLLFLSLSPFCLCVCLSADEFNPEVPKLEKSVSGSSPSRDRLLLTLAMLLMSALLLS